MVTGASRGIGRALALELARRGATLILVARDAAALEGVADEVRKAGGASETQVVDLAVGRDRAALGAALAQGPPLHGLVNNAGFGHHAPFAELPPESLRAMIEVNLLAPMLLARQLLPPMVAAGEGHLLDVASVAGFFAVPNEALYAATKAFLLSHDQALAAELAGTGVRVTCLAPGITETEFFATSRFDLDRYELPGIPIGSAEEVARVAVTATLRGKRRVVPGLRNRVLGFFFRHAPRSWARRFTQRALRERESEETS